MAINIVSATPISPGGTTTLSVTGAGTTAGTIQLNDIKHNASITPTIQSWTDTEIVVVMPATFNLRYDSSLGYGWTVAHATDTTTDTSGGTEAAYSKYFPPTGMVEIDLWEPVAAPGYFPYYTADPSLIVSGVQVVYSTVTTGASGGLPVTGYTDGEFQIDFSSVGGVESTQTIDFFFVDKDGVAGTQATLTYEPGEAVAPGPSGPANILWAAYNLDSNYATWRVEPDVPANLVVHVYAEADTAHATPLASSAVVLGDLNSPAALTVNGLTPDTEYLWRLEVNGALAPITMGRLHTLPAGAGNWSMVTGSCQGLSPTYPGTVLKTSDAPTFDFMRAKKANLFSHMGDMTYVDPNSTDPLVYAQNFRDAYAQPKFRDLLLNVGLEFTPEDHDVVDNVNGSHAGWPAYRTAYNNYFPVIGGLVTAVESRPAFRSRVVGNVRMIHLDTRSQRSAQGAIEDANKRMIGDEQWAALEKSLAEATEPTIDIMVGSGFIGSNATNPSDNWRAYTTERTRLIDLLKKYKLLSKTILRHGDTHQIAIDDGTNSNYGTDSTGLGPKVCCFSPLDCSNSEKGSPYNLGQYSSSKQQYGYLQYKATAVGVDVEVQAFALKNSGTKEHTVVSPTWSFADNNPFSQQSGGTARSDADYHYFEFMINGALELSAPITGDLFLVGGGGGSIRAGGGGGYTQTFKNVSIPAGSHSVVVGPGGVGGTETVAGGRGGATSLTVGTTVYEALGGLPAFDNGTTREGGDGGSGGGASASTNGLVGEGGSDGSNGGAGDRGVGGVGQGTTTRAFGEVTGKLYAGGGGGGNFGTTAKPGGAGGGGDGANGSESAEPGLPNTGGGAGGAGNAKGVDGGAGTLIVRVATVDETAPAMTLNGPAEVQTGPFDITLTAAESVSGVTLKQFKVVNGTASNLVAASSMGYTVTITPTLDAPGTITVDYDAGQVQDAAGNFNTAAPQYSVEYTLGPELLITATKNVEAKTVTLAATAQYYTAASVTFEADTGAGFAAINTDSIAPFEYVYDTSLLTDGSIVSFRAVEGTVQSNPARVRIGARVGIGRRGLVFDLVNDFIY